MRNFPVLLLMLVVSLGGCAWLGGDTEDPVPAAVAQDEAAAPEAAAGEAKAAPSSQKTKAGSSSKAKKGGKSEATIRAELDKVGKKLAAQASRTVMPSKSSKQVRKVDDGYVATYVQIDTTNVSTEMRPGTGGQYVGVVRYQEQVYECRGKSKKEALSAQCSQTRSRRLSELIRYDGKAWQY